MQKGIIGKKVGMTQIFDDKGNVVPVTVVAAGPCVVTQKKTVENDGYAAVQLGYGDLKATKVNKPMQGHFTKGEDVYKRQTITHASFIPGAICQSCITSGARLSAGKKRPARSCAPWNSTGKRAIPCTRPQRKQRPKPSKC